MRRRPLRALALTVATAVAAGCAAPASRPSAPHALEQVLPAASLDVAAVRSTALAFIQAYADTASDGGVALARLVAGSPLSEWVRWLGVQNGQFEGLIRSRAAAPEVTFVGVASTESYDLARVRLTASVTFQYEPFGAAAFERERVLDGPMTLVRMGVADWRVVDFTRDGVEISDGIRDLGDVRIEEDDITLELHSAFLFAAGWQFNVTIENATDGRIRLGSVALTTGAGTADGIATGPLLAIPPGTGTIGILAFPAGNDLAEPTLEIRYETADGTTVVLRADLSATIGDLPANDSSASPSP